MKKTETTHLKLANEGAAPDPATCFLSQGTLCMGSVTLDRCLSPCPEVGTPCSGCAGPTVQVLSEPNRDLRTELAERISRLTKIPAAEVITVIEESAKTHYAYAMATRMIGGKPTFLIKKWIEKIEAGA